MKERPILFSGPMVKAILEGRKTQTRRVVKLPRNVEHAEAELTRMQPGYEDGTRPIFGIDDEPNAFSVKCPYGAPGDRLWVRETWGLHAHGDMTDWCVRGDDITLDRWELQYRCDWGPAQDGCFWRPSIHMPRWASRITLEIESVRVERLQDISEEDAVAEGCNEAHLEHTEDCKSEHCSLAGGVDDCCGYLVSAKLEYKALWQSINGPGSWDANPFVWVIQFRRVL